MDVAKRHYRRNEFSLNLVLALTLFIAMTSGALQAQSIDSPTGAPPTSAPNVPANPPQTPGAPLHPADANLRIGPGDLLQIGVYGTSDYDRQVRVNEAGQITLPLLGTVKVGGFTVEQSERILEEKLSAAGYFNSPQVSVFVKEYGTASVSVLGEVQKPGIYAMLGGRRLLDVIPAAGGTTPKAGNTVTITHRDRPNAPETVKLSYDAGESPESNIVIQPGDTVVVNKAGIVYVVGDVKLPSGIIMAKPGMTVLQAISLAQGANSTASLNSVKVIRKNGDQRQEIPVPLKQILQAKMADVTLQPDDIIFVPTNHGRVAATRTLEAIVQTASGIAIYRP